MAQNILLSQSIKHCAKHITSPAGDTPPTPTSCLRHPDDQDGGTGLTDSEKNYDISQLIIIHTPGLRSGATDYFVYN